MQANVKLFVLQFIGPYSCIALLVCDYCTVVLRGGTTNADFRGFMIQGRVMADDSPVGTFDDDGATDYQVQCNQDVSLLTATIAVENYLHYMQWQPSLFMNHSSSSY